MPLSINVLSGNDSRSFAAREVNGVTREVLCTMHTPVKEVLE
jgi:hypothetical protein